jgi:hypothetical protein
MQRPCQAFPALLGVVFVGLRTDPEKPPFYWGNALFGGPEIQVFNPCGKRLPPGAVEVFAACRARPQAWMIRAKDIDLLNAK